VFFERCYLSTDLHIAVRISHFISSIFVLNSNIFLMLIKETKCRPLSRIIKKSECFLLAYFHILKKLSRLMR
jgi:hypothetical protein